jgi:hypothetical protein
MTAWARETERESSDHVYARWFAAQSHHAMGARHLWRGMRAQARDGFERAPRLVLAHAGLTIVDGGRTASDLRLPPLAMDSTAAVDVALAQAAVAAFGNDTAFAARTFAAALSAAPPGGAGWTLPIDPLIGVRRAPEVWADALGLLRNRAR